MLGPAEHHGKDTIQETLKTIGNAHVWLIQCCKSCANRYNIIDCEQSLFSQSSLGKAGLERVNWPTGKLERGGTPRLSLASLDFLTRMTILRDCSQSNNYCCAMLWWSQNKRNVGSCWLKISLTSFKLCTTTPYNIQQHATGCADRRKMWHSTMLGNVGQQCCIRLPFKTRRKLAD